MTWLDTVHDLILATDRARAHKELVPVQRGECQVHLPAASAAILMLRQ